MSVAATLPDLLAPRFDRRELVLWAAAGLLVVAAHAAAMLMAERWREPEPYLDEAAPAVMLELAPMMTAPEAVPEQIAELVDSAASADPVADPVEHAQPVPAPVAEPVEEATPAEMVVERVQADAQDVVAETPERPETTPAAEPDKAVPVDVSEVAPVETADEAVPEQIEETVPDLVEAPLPEVALAVPAPRPERVEPVEEPDSKKPKKKAMSKPAKQSAPPASAAARKSAENAPNAAAPRAQGATGKSISPARWQSRVNAHLNRHKRFPRGSSANGVVTVRFTIDPGGAVQSVAVTRSSGDPGLDAAAIDMVNRASPVPAPPPEIARPRMSLTVPVRFSRR